MGQIIVRVLVGLVSVATAFTMNTVAPKQTSQSAQVRNNTVAKVTKDIKVNKPIIQSHPSGVVRQSSLTENEYGAHWDDSDSTPTFVDGNGDAFVKNAKGVIDVSEHQHEIDWEAVKDSGVDGAIIRISYGWDNGYDKQAIRNINECKRLGIPFGIYMYSYAEKAADGAAEGADVVKLLKNAGVKPEDLTYPVYYDLEKWTWSGHQPPTSPYVYQDIVASWWNQLVSAGYHKLGVYSYTNYLKGPLNSEYIHQRTSWVANYGSQVGFPISTALRGWQYTSDGSVDGIDGRVDMNAFGMADGGEINGVSEYGNTVEKPKPAENSNNTTSTNHGAWTVNKTGRREVWTNGDKRFVLQYELRDSYYAHGGYARLGAPVDEEENMGDGWWRQCCENGDVWTHGRDKKFVIQYDLRDAYYSHGGHARLGAPVAEEENMGGGWWRQRCKNGDLWTYGSSKKFVIQYELRDSYYAHRGASWLGAPVAEEENMGGGWWRQRCTNGDVWTHGRNKKFVIMFNLRKDYYAHGDFAKVGAPVEDEHYDGKGLWHQRCQKYTLEAR